MEFATATSCSSELDFCIFCCKYSSLAYAPIVCHESEAISLHTAPTERVNVNLTVSMDMVLGVTCMIAPYTCIVATFNASGNVLSYMATSV